MSEFYILDSVYDERVSTRQIYEESASPLIEATLLGMNATIFAYGQTSSGKTFTMQGSPSLGTFGSSSQSLARDSESPCSEMPETTGIIPLALRHIFDMIQRVIPRNYVASYSL